MMYVVVHFPSPWLHATSKLLSLFFNSKFIFLIYFLLFNLFSAFVLVLFSIIAVPFYIIVFFIFLEYQNCGRLLYRTVCRTKCSQRYKSSSMHLSWVTRHFWWRLKNLDCTMIMIFLTNRDCRHWLMPKIGSLTSKVWLWATSIGLVWTRLEV